MVNVDIEEPYEENFRYINQKEWFARLMPLLRTRYRRDMVDGLVLCAGSQIGTVSDMAFEPFKNYLSSSSSSRVEPHEGPQLLGEIVWDVSGVMEKNYGSNRVFIPCLIMSTRLVKSGLVAKFPSENMKEGLTDIVNMACKGIKGVKSIDRITAAMGLVIASLPLEEVNKDISDHLGSFLGHRFPRIRSMCAEQLYLALSDTNDELDADLEEILLETTWTEEGVQDRAAQVVDLVKRTLV